MSIFEYHRILGGTTVTAPLSWTVGFLRGFAGAVAGGAIGYFAFFWLVRQGLYALVLPGTLVGLGFGALSGRRSIYDGVFCAVCAAALGLFIEWQFDPFLVDKSFTFFLSHAHELRGIKLILIGVSILLAYWFGQGRQGGPWRKSSSTLC